MGGTRGFPVGSCDFVPPTNMYRLFVYRMCATRVKVFLLLSSLFVLVVLVIVLFVRRNPTVSPSSHVSSVSAMPGL